MDGKPQKRFFHELEGVRGYAFLVVFAAHAIESVQSINSLRLPGALRVAMELSWVTVPIFFVMSGFLITGILLRTRERSGYFRVFYLRRMVRILPVYYVMLGCLAAMRFTHEANVPYLAHRFLFISNLSKVGGMYVTWRGQEIYLWHMWSLCIEEQFYLLWPLVVWLCKSEKTFKRVCFVLIGLACVFRFAWPLLHMAPGSSYANTLTRFDALVLGALMAVYFERPVYAIVEKWAGICAICGGALVMLIAVVSGPAKLIGDSDYWHEMLEHPLINITALAVVICVMKHASRAQRMCQGRTIAKLGSMTYSAYIFHNLYLPYFCGPVYRQFLHFMPSWLAMGLSSGMAFALTMGLAYVSFELIEKPGMRLKERIKFGAAGRESTVRVWRREPSAESAGSVGDALSYR